MRWICSILLVVAFTACDRDDPPSTPTGLQATAGDQTLNLSWKANPEADLASYLIRYQDSLSGQSQAKTIAAPATNAVLDGLANNTTYRITLLAMDKAGQKSAESGAILASPKAAPLPDLPPAKPAGLRASPQDGQVALNWTPNNESNLKLYRLRYGTEASNLDRTQTLEANATSTVVVGLTNGTSYVFALEAENTKGLVSALSETVASTPKATPKAPIVQEVAISGYGLSNQVRQGIGDIEITVRGLHLETLQSAKLGNYILGIKTKQATEAQLSATLPHGIPVGNLDLQVTNDVGSFTREAAIEVCKITIAANPDLSPSDTDGKGTPNRPFRTLTKALTVAAKGDTLLLTAGVYQTNESWPQQVGGTYSPNVPDGVSLEGQSSDRGAVLLQGPGNTQEIAGLVFAGNASVRNLTVRGFKYALLHSGNPATPTAQISLQNIASSGNFDGLHLRFAKGLDIAASLFSSNTASGVYLLGAYEANISSSQMLKNQFGLVAALGPQVQGNGITVKENSGGGVLLEQASADFYDSEFSQNTNYGISLGSMEGKQNLRVLRSNVINNGGQGIWIRGFPHNVIIGISGNPNAVQLNGNTAFEIYDERQANTGENTFFFVNAQIRGAVPPNAALGPGAEPAGVKIVNPGNIIRFNVL